MKKLKVLIGVLIIGIWACSCGTKHDKTMDMHDHSSMQPENQKPASPLKMAMQNIGSNHVHIAYSAPSVRGRVIWGALVPYDKIWVTGAHMATSVQFAKDLMIGGTRVPAGKYAVFTIPGKDTWTVIINKNWEQHQADKYDQKEDVLRFTVSPELQNNITEQLIYEVTSSGSNKGIISMCWEKLKISFEVESVE